MTSVRSKAVIIVAGGVGNRMNAKIPKQFLPLSGKPLLIHSLEKFHEYDAEIKIIVAMNENYLAHWQSLLREFDCNIPHHVVNGGKTRFSSVKNALPFVGNCEFTAVHDAARPLVSISLISNLFEVAEKLGMAIPAIPITESIRSVKDDVSKSVDRSLLRLIQTPQIFGTEILKSAYLLAYQADFTDDASVVEANGATIVLANGEPQNIKITNLHDLQIAEFFFYK